MGFYFATTISIKENGAFDVEALGGIDAVRKRIEYVRLRHKEIDDTTPPGSLSVSEKLEAGKGALVVIGGVFKNWFSESSFRFAAAISKEFKTQVIWTSWAIDGDSLSCAVFDDGEMYQDPYLMPIEVLEED